MVIWTEDSVASELLACEAERRDRVRFTEDWPDLDLDTGYRIQDETLRRRLARGETLVGVKLGLTSRAKQQRMGLDTPLVAWLTDAMVLQPGDPVPQDQLIHPRVEPEIVFLMAERLVGPGVTAEQALAAVGSVHAGAEVIDSRFRDFKFTAGDVVADNASSGAYVVAAEGLAPGALDLVAEEVSLEVDGEQVDRATGAAVLGHPAEALALAVNELARRGLAVEAGWTVLTGGMTDAVYATPGSTVACRFATLGAVELFCGTPHEEEDA
jgi:2-oxo-3-hexenedioate decarboxylase